MGDLTKVEDSGYDLEAHLADAVPEHTAALLDDLSGIQRRTFTGVLNLVGRELAIKLLGLGGGIVLARVLDPAAFGLLAIASFAVSLFAMFAELGLGAAFIRRKGEVSTHELNALFTFQLILVSLLAGALFFSAPLVAQIYKEPAVLWLVRALSVSLFVIALRSVPVIISERKLDYGPVALADVSGQVAYWLVAVIGALFGLGVWSLVLAVFISGMVGTIALYVRTKWRPSLQFDLRPLRSSMRFGLLFQGQTAVHFVKDTMLPSLGGIVYGGAAVGYLSWAQQLAATPMQLTQLVGRVSYPALARLQDNPQAFSALMANTLKWTCRVSFPAFAVLIGLSSQIIQYVYGPKWFPSLPSLYFFYINMVLGVGAGVLMPALYSIGRAAAALRISVIWTILTWSIALVLIASGMGFSALALAYAIGTAVAIVLIVSTVRDLGDLSFLLAIRLPVASAVLVAGLLYITAPALIHNIWALAVIAALAGLLGLTVNLWEDRTLVISALRSFLSRKARTVEGTNRP